MAHLAPLWLDHAPLGRRLAQSWPTLAFLWFFLPRSWSRFAALCIDYGSLLLHFGSAPFDSMMVYFGAQTVPTVRDRVPLCLDKLQRPNSANFDR